MVILSSVAEILNGDRSSNYPSGNDFISYGIPFINAGHLINGRIDFSNMDYISPKKYEQLSGAKIRRDDVLLCLRGSLGKYAISRLDKGAPASSIAVIRPNRSKINTDYLMYIISSFIIQKQIELENNGSSQPNLSASSVANFRIPVPSLSEQKRIAEALSDVDELISSLEKLIAKYKSIKATCLQQMFPQKGETTPKMRLPGFTGAWEQCKLGDVCQVTMGQSPDGSTYSDTPSDYILVQGNADLKDGWVSPRIWTTQKTKTAEAGDLIMSVRAPAGSMGKTSYNVVLGRGVAGIKGNEFIYQSLVKMDSDGYWKKLAAGSTFESINSDVVNGAELIVPQDIDEQNKIGDYFASIDNLITLHQRKLDKAKKIKQGMMQQLLTGKIRLM